LKLRGVLATVNGIAISPDIDLDVEIECAFGADLMSDVLRLGHEEMLLITGLTNPQVVRTAEMLGIQALLFVRAKLPSPDTMALAMELGIFLLATRYTMYEACGRLYGAGLAGLGSCGEFTQAP